MYPQHAMVDCRSGDDRLGLAEGPVYLLEAIEEAGQGTRAGGDVGPDLHVAPSQFAGDDTEPFFANRVIYPKQILGQQFTKAPVNLADSLRLDSKAALEAAAIYPFLHGDVRLGFKLQIALAGILAVIVPERALDIDGVGVVALNEIGVVAVHGPHQVGERGQKGRGKAAAEA